MAQYDERNQQRTDAQDTSQYDQHDQAIRGNQYNAGRDHFQYTADQRTTVNRDQHVHNHAVQVWLTMIVLLIGVGLLVISLWKFGYILSPWDTSSVGGNSTPIGGGLPTS